MTTLRQRHWESPRLGWSFNLNLALRTKDQLAIHCIDDRAMSVEARISPECWNLTRNAVLVRNDRSVKKNFTSYTVGVDNKAGKSRNHVGALGSIADAGHGDWAVGSTVFDSSIVLAKKLYKSVMSGLSTKAVMRTRINQHTFSAVAKSCVLMI